MTANEAQELSSSAMLNLRREIASLATLAEADAPVVSAYFDLREAKEHLRSGFAMWAIAARNTLPKELRAAFDQARVEIEQALREVRTEETASLAVFARAGEHRFIRALPFAATMESHYEVAPAPAIFPLVQLKDRFHRFVLAICGEETGRIIEMTLGAVSLEILATRPEVSGRGGRQWTREHFHQRRHEDTRRFVRDQIDIITNLMARRGLNHLILAGHPRNIAQMRDSLPKHIQGRVVGSVFHAPNGSDYTPLLDEALAIFVRAEQEESKTTVERLHEQVRRKGLAVVGIHPCRRAIAIGAASELVISEELPVADREELVRLASAHDLPIEVCEGDELLASHGGVGCLLRYRMEFATQATDQLT